MKDLYTFDKTVEAARETYDLICQAYDNIFQRLNVPFVKGITNSIFQLIFVLLIKSYVIVVGSTGNIGGLSSHEYHFPSSIGEDDLKMCSVCNSGSNAEISIADVCSNCGSTDMKQSKGIEVHHS